METKNLRFEMKELTVEGKFSGYGSTFENIDNGDDIIEKGAFTKTIKEHGGTFPMLWSHDSHEPIGVISGVEDEKGLAVEGQINLDVQRGREVYSLLKMGAIKGLSIGYRCLKSDIINLGDRILRRMQDVKLFEISPVVFPMNEMAQVETVKAADQISELVKIEVARQLSEQSKALPIVEPVEPLPVVEPSRVYFSALAESLKITLKGDLKNGQ